MKLIRKTLRNSQVPPTDRNWSSQSPLRHGDVKRGQTTQTQRGRGAAESPAGWRSRSETSGTSHWRPGAGGGREKEVPGQLMVWHRDAWEEIEDKEEKLGREGQIGTQIGRWFACRPTTNRLQRCSGFQVYSILVSRKNMDCECWAS